MEFFMKVCWCIFNIIIFIECYYCYASEPEFYYLREILGVGLFISRAAASVLNINCFLILLPMCRFLNSYIHRTFSIINRTLLKYWLYNSQSIHVMIAFTILTASVLHSFGHILNAINASVHYNHLYPSLNWASYQYESPFILIIGSSSSGLCMMLFLITMAVFSVPCARHRDYVLFSTAHYLFLPFVLLYLIHPFSKILKQQINYNEHIPGCIQKNCTSEPIFEPIPIQSWKLMVPAICIYIFDLIYRVATRNFLVYNLQSVKKYPGNVYKMILRSQKIINIQPAQVLPHLDLISDYYKILHFQYILLQCPKISSIEWHPFTAVSCTNNKNNLQTDITIFMLACGDWTNFLASYLQKDLDLRQLLSSHQENSYRSYRFLVDGGFTSPLTDILKTDVAFCIANGIGITPFASILSYLNEFCDTSNLPFRLHLVWVVPYVEYLLWFEDLLTSAHDKNWKCNKPDRLEYRLYVTREKDNTKIEMIKNTVIKNRIYFEKPNWANILSLWHSLYFRSSYSLFICGSKNLCKSVEETCDELTKKNIIFKRIHEAFT